MSRRMFQTTLLAMATAVSGQSFAATGPGASEGTGSSAAPSASGGTVTDLNEIVIVANRYEAADLQMKSDNAISVLSAEDLANTAVHNVAEALS